MSAMKPSCAVPELSRIPCIPSERATAPATGYYPALGSLRAFLIVLVVAHHAVLAYHPFAPPLAGSFADEPRLWRAFPVIDPAKSQAVPLLVGFNDMFFMSLLFFISGLFVWKSLQRKGAAHFLKDRAIRLGLPFAIGAAFLAPLAYYPAFLQRSSGQGIGAFVEQWLRQPDWPAGPVWFIWVLLVFNCLAAAVYRLVPKTVETAGRWLSVAFHLPSAFFHTLIGVSALAYIPLSLNVNPLMWSAFGPFTFQTSRVLHYAAYFLLGTIVGSYAIEEGLLATRGKLARKWSRWAACAVLVFLAAGAVIITAMTTGAGQPGWSVLGSFMFVLSCAASSFGVTAIFLRFFTERSRAWDSLASNAYGIYLVHYVFVNWLQYALLKTSMPGLAKGIVVTLLGLALSWSTVAALRRIPVRGWFAPAAGSRPQM